MAQKKPGDAAKAKGNSKTPYLIGGIVVLVGAAWMVAGGGGSGSTGPLPTPAEFQALAATADPNPDTGIPLGSPQAAVVIEEFIDFSCPSCANFAGFAAKLIRQNYVETDDFESGGGGPVRWVSYDFVIGSFPNSVPAAMAARCADEQGLYWPMHDFLFARQAQWYTSASPARVFSEIAEEVGVAMSAYNACMGESRYLDDIAESRAFALQRGVGSTPTVFLDGQLVTLPSQGAYEYIETLIQERLNPGDTPEGAEADPQ